MKHENVVSNKLILKRQITTVTVARIDYEAGV